MKFSGFGKSRKKIKKQIYSDLGFGTSLTNNSRFINKDGSLNVTRKGRQPWTPYQSLVEMSWRRFIVIIVSFYILINLSFALLHLLIGIDTLRGLQASDFLEDLGNAFFFSVQTFTTVGYGTLSPDGLSANIISALNALIGLISFALATGLFFARFSKPRAQILFSENAIIAPYRGITSLQFRIANSRHNNIIHLSAQVVIAWLEKGTEEKLVRRFAVLPLERDKVFLFPLNWTIVHPIDDESPLYRKTETDFLRMKVEIMILIKGFDETFAQDVYVNSSYTAQEIIWNAKFQMMFHEEEGRTVLDLDRINDIVKA